MIHLNNELIII